jgi:ABC-2 type transport system permease protein
VFAVMFSIQNFGAEGEEVAEAFSVMFPFIFAMAAAMVNDTSSSISLEGKTFPLLKSLPVSPKEILRSKLYLHMAFCAPVILVCGIAVSVVNGLPAVGVIATLVIPLCYAYSAGIVGLLINLKNYKFDWTSEVMVAKNNLPMVLTMLGGMVLSLAPMGIALKLYFVGLPLAAILGGCTALAVIFAVVATILMNAFGEKWFLKIEY